MMRGPMIGEVTTGWASVKASAMWISDIPASSASWARASAASSLAAFSGFDRSKRPGKNPARVVAAGRPLLSAAQEAHKIRPDLTLEQVLDMIIAIAQVKGSPSYREPILRTALDGLREGAE